MNVYPYKSFVLVIQELSSLSGINSYFIAEGNKKELTPYKPYVNQVFVFLTHLRKKGNENLSVLS